MYQNIKKKSCLKWNYGPVMIAIYGIYPTAVCMEWYLKISFEDSLVVLNNSPNSTTSKALIGICIIWLILVRLYFYEYCHILACFRIT